MARAILWSTCLALIALSGGCTTTPASRDVARLTLEQVVAYEAAIQTKIAAEQNFYSTTFKAYQDAIEKGMKDQEVNLQAVESQAFARASLNLKTSKLTREDLRLALTASVESVVALRQRGRQEKEKRAAEFTASMEKLRQDADALRKVRKGLEELQSKPSDRKELESAIKFSREVWKEIKPDEEK